MQSPGYIEWPLHPGFAHIERARPAAVPKGAQSDHLQAVISFTVQWKIVRAQIEASWI